MLQGEHSALLSTFIKLPIYIKTFVLSIFKWPLKTGFTAYDLLGRAIGLFVMASGFKRSPRGWSISGGGQGCLGQTMTMTREA